MATVTKPLALDESINTTEQTPRNVADVLAQGLDAIEQAIASGSGSGGHTIVNASGTDMTQRAKMQFVDAVVTDDAVNDVTKISTTPASYPSANVSYGSGSVKDALDDVKDEISTLQKGFKSQTMNVTTGAQGDAGLGLYAVDIQIVTVYAKTWAIVGLYLYNGEWGIRSDQKNTTLSITITYYDV